MRKRLGWIGGVVVGAIAVAGALTTVHAQSGVSGSDMSRAVDFSGPWEVTATLDNGTVINPRVSGGVYDVDHKGSASYVGSIAQPDVPRAHSGSVEVSTPPGAPSIEIKDPWGEDDAETVSDSGNVT